MKILTTVSLLFAAAGLAACGGSTGTVQQFRTAAPTLEKLAITQNDGDLAEAYASSDSSAGALLTPAAPECHPHLFLRSHDIMGRVNRHFHKQLHHVEELIANHPLNDGETKTWENVRGGIDRKFTMTRTANPDGSTTFDFELDVAAVSSGTTGTFVKVMWGTVVHIGPFPSDADAGAAGQLVEEKGTVTFDYTALASVVPRERASGQIVDAFDNARDPVKGIKRSASITLKDFVPEEGDRHGPRNGTWEWVREPGIGGKFLFQDTAVLFCVHGPAGAQSDLTTVSRWYKADNDQVRARSDSKATGGQLDAGQTWMGVTCAKGPTSTTPAEGFWMVKLEDSTGATVASRLAQGGAEPCDPVFGAVPSATDNETDYDFSAPVSFPGEW